jgi:hypothetical protein
MASAAILKAVKLLRNYCQITVRLPLDYSAIIWHSQELRSGMVPQWATPPSNIPFVAVGRDGACGHRGPAGGENESVGSLVIRKCRGQGITVGECLARATDRSRPVSSRTPLHGTHGLAVGQWACRSQLFGETLQGEGGLLAHRVAAPGISSAMNKPRGACTVRADLPANHTPSALLMGPGTAVAARAEPGCLATSPPSAYPWGKTAVIAQGERQAGGRMKNIG